MGQQVHEYLPSATVGKPITAYGALQCLFKHQVASVATRFSGVAPLASDYGAWFKLNSYFGLDNTADRFMPCFLFDLTAKPGQTTHPFSYRGSIKATTGSWEWKSTAVSTTLGSGFNPTGGMSSTNTVQDPGHQEVYRTSVSSSAVTFPTCVYWKDSRIRLMLRGASNRTTEFFIEVHQYLEDEMLPESANSDLRTAFWLARMTKAHYSPLVGQPTGIDRTGNRKRVRVLYRRKVVINLLDGSAPTSHGLQNALTVKLNPRKLLEYRIPEAKASLDQVGTVAPQQQFGNTLPLNIPNTAKGRLFLVVTANQPFHKTQRDDAAGTVWGPSDPTGSAYSYFQDGSFDLVVNNTFIALNTV